MRPASVWLTASVAAATLATWSLTTIHRTPPEEPLVLAVADADYFEDAPGARPVGAVQATVLARGDDLWLQVAVAATGDHVEPVPGFDGVQGANLRTAEELHRLLAEDALHLELRAHGSSQRGTVATVERARLPARAIAPDGRLLLRTTTAAELPVRVSFRSAPLPAGISQSYLVADDVPRLRVEVERRGDSARILTIESLGDPANAPFEPQRRKT